MRGFDRPVKPEWIYKMVQKLETGDKLSEHKEELDEVLKELNGKTGKRKVRTVIGRYFFKNINNPRGHYVEDSLVFNLIKQKSFEETKAIMLFNLLTKAPILQYFSEQIFKLYSGKKEIKADFLREKAYQRFGERDIARRSLRNFLSTLVDFEVLKQKKNNTFIWNEKLEVSEENAVNFLKLYAKFYLDSLQVSLYDLPEYLTFYFALPDLKKVAKKYNNIHWDYIRRVNTAVINIYTER